jgi:sn-glycerol 3-phosphate transport system ATP-binding protein
MANIDIRQVRKSYGKDEVIHGVDLTVNNGEFVVILGPSGCGKSTLLRMIAGLEDISGGEISIGGTVVNDLEPRQRGCAMVFQNYALYPHMTVAENIGYALKVAGMKKPERLEKVRAVAKSVGLEEFMDRKPGQLSGGQRQRVAMARAIIREPKVFLFDEPLSNLDAKLRVQMRHEIRRIHNRIKATSVFVTHDQHEGMTLADRMVIMNKGTIDQVGTPEEVYNRPATVYVAGFIGSPAMNFLSGQISAEQSAILLADDSRIEIASDAARRHAGALVQLGLRPEDMTLCAPGAGHLIGSFDFYEELGSSGLYHLMIEDVPFTVLSSVKPRFQHGDQVGVLADLTKLHVFAAKDGVRINMDAHATQQMEPAE